MPRLSVLTACLLLCAVALAGAAQAAGPAAPAAGPRRDPAGVKGYAVHEWGVFTIHPDLEMANAALAAEWADCPRELYRTEPPNLRNLPWRGSVRKPIVYFHWDADPPPPEKGLTMKVRFPDGRPVIWWPASQEGEGIEPQGQEVTDSLSWRLFLGRQPDGRGPFGARPRTPAVAADHWYAKARMVKAEPVFSYGSWSGKGDPIDAEQFVYYDGLMKSLAFLKARRTATGDLVLDNTAPYPLHDLWCVDHSGDPRTGKAARLARVPLVPVGTKEIVPEWRTVPDADWAQATAEQLAADLERTGLHADEARSLVAIWQPGFFHAPGLTLFYRLPQREYDRVTTIALDPVPETLVRVGIVLHAHAEPERAAGANEPGGEARPAEPVVPVGPAIEPLRLEKRLTVAEAEKLATADRDLCLFGLSGISADVADAVAGSKAKALNLWGLTTLDAAAAKALARFEGQLLSVSGLASLDAQTATALAEFKGNALSCGGLTAIDAATAEALAASTAWDCNVRELATLDADTAAALTRARNWDGRLPKLTAVDAATAKALVAAQKWDGQLPGVTAFERPDAVAAATALAKRQGPVALPNLRKISPKTLSALITKEDVQIPLIETLELIQEPDGSETDDFVIPKGFQQRQRR